MNSRFVGKTVREDAAEEIAPALGGVPRNAEVQALEDAAIHVRKRNEEVINGGSGRHELQSHSLPFRARPERSVGNLLGTNSSPREK